MKNDVCEVEDIFASAEKEELEFLRNSCVRIYKGFIEIDMDSSTKFNRVYDIPLSRLRTPNAVLDWIHQVLIGKSWATPKMHRDFIKILFDYVIPTEWWSGKS